MTTLSFFIYWVFFFSFFATPSCQYEVMHDPSNFADPDRFDPTRFVDPETGRYRAPRAYVPFGVGRRECLGKSVARQELFLFTASLLQQFRSGRSG